MRKLLQFAVLVALAVISPFAKAQTGTFQSFCEDGGVKVLTSGLASSTTVQASYPQCVVNVYLTGTLTLATIFRDGNNTPLNNPFTASLDGYWLFWAATGQGYDVVMSGGTPNAFSSPKTLTDLIIPVGGSGTPTVVEVNGTPISPATPANFVNSSSVTWAFTSGHIVATASGGGGSGCVPSGGLGTLLIVGSSGTCPSSPADYNVSDPDSFFFRPTGNFDLTASTFDATLAADFNVTTTGHFDVTATDHLDLSSGNGTNISNSGAGSFILSQFATSNFNITAAGQLNLSVGTDWDASITGHFSLATVDITNPVSGSTVLCVDPSGNLGTFGCSAGSGGVTTINGTPGAFTFSFSSGAGSCTGTTCTFTGSSSGSGTVTNFIASSGSWPTWLVPSVATSTTTPTLSVTASAIPNSALATQTANTVLGALTATTPSGLAMPSCSGSTNALIWTSGTGFGCNTISGSAVSSVSNSDGTLTISPTTGAVVASLALGHANTWTALQTLVGTNITGVPLTTGITGILGSTHGGTGINNSATLTLGSSNQNWATIGTGLVKVTTTTGAISDAVSADVIALWSGTCSSSTFLRGDGTCATASASTAWSAIGNPTTNLALTMAANTTVFTYGATTSTPDMMKWTDTASNTGTGILGHFTTASGSTEIPWQADSNGVGWKVGADGSLAAVGSSASHGMIMPAGTALTPVATSALITTDSSGDLLGSSAGGTVKTILLGTFPWSCQPGEGDGFNAVPSGTYLQTSCYNDTGQTVTLTGIKCFTDNSGSSTMAATNGAGTALLTGAVTCTSSFAAGTQSGTTTIASGDFIKFTFVADGTSKQSSWVVTGTHP